MRFVIVTGMSGGGKSTAIRILEDAGFYCADNLPVSLIEKFIELIAMPESGISRAALGLDVRTDQRFEEASRTIGAIREKGYPCEVLFMDASDAVLIKRYKETRRLHPLSPKGRVEEGIRREREVLEETRRRADYVIDTSKLLTRELKAELDRIFLDDKRYNSLMISIVSFGFKNGIPSDADLVFDVRFLPNPFYIDELKRLTGNDAAVKEYVYGFPECTQFLDKLTDLLEFLIPNYVREGKYQLVVAIGCTGGQHRSVAIANAVYERLKDRGEYGLSLSHRDAE